MKTDFVLRLHAKDILLQQDAVRMEIKSETGCGQLSSSPGFPAIVTSPFFGFMFEQTMNQPSFSIILMAEIPVKAYSEIV